MPADDLILNVKQIDGYPTALNAVVSDALILQRGGLGGPYLSISPTALVATALANGGDMAVGGKVAAQAFSGGSAQFSNAAVNLFSAQKACVVEFDAMWGSIAGKPIATQDFVAGATVRSFNGRRGDVCLWITDILNAGGAPNFSPVFGGEPRAPTPAANSNNSRLATTLFVQRNFVEGVTNLLADHPFVFTFNGRTGDVLLTQEDILAAGGGTVFDNVNLTGIPTAPTAAAGIATQQIATTAFVAAAISGSTIWAPINSPNFTGFPSAPTAPIGTSTGQIASTAFVMNAVEESTTGVSSFNLRTGAVSLEQADVTAVGGALLASPIFTGTPSGPTAAPGTSNAELASTAFVAAAISAVSGVASFNTRTGAIVLTTADITGAGGAPIASPTFTGSPAVPTAAPGTSSLQAASTAFVSAAVNASVLSFNGRNGVVTLNVNDVSAAGGLTNPSVALTGVPTAPNPTFGANTTQVATTAFVQAALAAGGGVLSFNGRAGAVTLTGADITAAGGVLAGALPTGQVFTATGTYTPPAGVKRIRVRMVGGGGGGGGVVGVNSGGNGGNSSLLGWTALGGTGGLGGAASSTGGAGSAGGTGGANGTGNQIVRLPGGVGGSGQSLAGQVNGVGGSGGSTPFGSGAVVRPLLAAPVINNGAGGTGAFSNSTTIGGGGGGGGGEYVEFYVASPATGAATIGAGGASGAAGGGGVAGGAGSPGLIIVEEFYQ